MTERRQCFDLERPFDANRSLRLGPRRDEIDNLPLDAQNITGAHWSQQAQFIDAEADDRIRTEGMTPTISRIAIAAVCQPEAAKPFKMVFSASFSSR
jgi:hypothetical protein